MITLMDVKQARETIQSNIKETPIFTSEQLTALCGNQLFLKGEHVQKTGSFKIRGATNKVKAAVQQGASFITAASSGNHGQAVAYIANVLGVPVTIVVPEDISNCKQEAIETYQGKIEKSGTTSQERIPRAQELAEKMNGVYIPPYDDPLIMAGQGTLGLEILEQVNDVEVVVVPVGGGGLMAGVLTAVKEVNPNVKVIGVEPESANDTYLSLQLGEITRTPPSTTIADGLRTSQPGDLTFPILQKYLDDLVLVSEAEIRVALRFVFERMKQVIEPSSATTVAAAMSGKLGVTGRKIVSIISGGNIDIQQLGYLIDK